MVRRTGKNSEELVKRLKILDYCFLTTELPESSAGKSANSLHQKWWRYLSNRNAATLEGLVDLATASGRYPFLFLSHDGTVYKPPQIGEEAPYISAQINYLGETLEIECLSPRTSIQRIEQAAEEKNLRVLFLANKGTEEPMVYERLNTQIELVLSDLLDQLEAARVSDCDAESYRIISRHFQMPRVKQLFENFNFSEKDIWFLLHGTFERDGKKTVRFGRLLRTHVVFTYLMENLKGFEAETPNQIAIRNGFMEYLDYRRRELFFRKAERMDRKTVKFFVYTLPNLIQKDRNYWNRLMGRYTELIQPIINQCAIIEKRDDYLTQQQAREIGDVPHAFTGPLIGHTLEDVFKIHEIRAPNKKLKIAVINDQLGLLYATHLKLLGYGLYGVQDKESGPDNGYPGYFVSGEQFLDFAENTSSLPDAMLVDIDLGPGNMKGYDLVRRIKERYGSEGIPKIIIMSFQISAEGVPEASIKTELITLQREGLIVGYVSKFNMDYYHVGELLGAYS
ncbi:hypothetical protein JW930_05620 [Candidatus Woesearchaeota archaeon]|nr:hypothetical protein [Candidatus Woesearchaeota archaeon]